MERKNLKIKKYLPIALIQMIGDKMLEVDGYIARAYIKNVIMLAFATNFEIDGKKEEAAIDYITENSVRKYSSYTTKSFDFFRDANEFGNDIRNNIEAVWYKYSWQTLKT